MSTIPTAQDARLYSVPDQQPAPRKWFGWLTVAEALPANGVDVLLWWNDHFPMDVGRFDGQQWYDANDETIAYGVTPEAWMPLPPTPSAPG